MLKDSNGQFPAKTIVNWKETTDCPDWHDAELLGAIINNEELKFLWSTLRYSITSC
ncbi:MAG: hypothetical protein AAGE84_06640 [Cyanobacteria bacterium P01_G01_bin.39]